MSERNLEVVRRSIEAFASGDFDAAFASFDPRAEWRTADDEPDSRTYRGIDEVRRFVSALPEPWTHRFDRTVLPEQYIDLEDWVVVPTSGVVHGRGSGFAAARSCGWRSSAPRGRRSRPSGRARRANPADRRGQPAEPARSPEPEQPRAVGAHRRAGEGVNAGRSRVPENSLGPAHHCYRLRRS